MTRLHRRFDKGLGNAVAMGEAAGVVAAIASKSARLPHEVEWKEAEQVLVKLGMRS